MTEESRSPHNGGSAHRWVILVVAILAYGTTHFARLNFAGIQRLLTDDLALDRVAVMFSIFIGSTRRHRKTPPSMTACPRSDRGVVVG